VELGKLKRAILQELAKNSQRGEYTRGKVLDNLFNCDDRRRKEAIESLHFDGYPIIVAKSKNDGYKLSYDPTERKEYYERRKVELKKQFASITKLQELDESGELFAQDFVVDVLAEKKLEDETTNIP
jgi:hypothetical protein